MKVPPLGVDVPKADAPLTANPFEGAAVPAAKPICPPLNTVLVGASSAFAPINDESGVNVGLNDPGLNEGLKLGKPVPAMNCEEELT